MFTYELNGDAASVVITVQDAKEGVVINNFLEDNFLIEFADGILGKIIIEDSTAVFVHKE